MATYQDRILAYLQIYPAGAADDQLAAALGIASRQGVNQVCRALAAQGRLRRSPGADGKIVNRLPGSGTGLPPAPAPPSAPPPAGVPSVIVRPLVALPTTAAIQAFVYPGEVALAEDTVKAAVAAVLEADGWTVRVQWGHAPGIDLVATRGAARWVIEAKGEGSRPQMRVNYFLGALGELLQRMDLPGASYALALPAHRQFLGLILRLPLWVRTHLALHFFLVRPTQDGSYEVGLIPPSAALPRPPADAARSLGG